MEKNVRDELASLLGVTATPIFSRIWRHPNSMPQYHVGHEARVKRIEAALQQFPTLALAGSAYHGVGISDCVRTGEEAAEKIVASVLRTRRCAAPLRTIDNSSCHFDRREKSFFHSILTPARLPDYEFGISRSRMEHCQ